MSISPTLLKAMATDHKPLDPEDVVAVCDELFRCRDQGEKALLSWPSHTDWRVQCSINLPHDPDDEDFAYAFAALTAMRDAYAAHRRRREAKTSAPCPGGSDDASA